MTIITTKCANINSMILPTSSLNLLLRSIRNRNIIVPDNMYGFIRAIHTIHSSSWYRHALVSLDTLTYLINNLELNDHDDNPANKFHCNLCIYNEVMNMIGGYTEHDERLYLKCVAMMRSYYGIPPSAKAGFEKPDMLKIYREGLTYEKLKNMVIDR